jgi:hypothetical protein
MLLRRFNQAGIDRFRGYVATLKTDKTLPAPEELVADDALSELITPITECADATFANRLAAAEYLDRLLGAANLGDGFDDVGLWAWLALRFFDQLRPLGPGISLKQLGVDEARFIPTNNWEDRHRHLLRHPLQVYRMAGRDARRALCFLVQPVHRPGDFVEQLGSRQLYLRNKEMLATLSELVVDSATLSLRRNASSKARRLDTVLQQFDCTWDLDFIAKDLLVPLLPDEFKELRRPQS